MTQKKKESFPKSIQIMGRKWKIKQVKNLTYNGDPVLGLCDYTGRMIYLESEQLLSEKKATLYHEVAHAWLILCGLDQKMSVTEVEINCQLVTALIEDIIKAFK